MNDLKLNKQNKGNYALKSDLISGYSEDDLVGLIKKLDEKITKLENK